MGGFDMTPDMMYGGAGGMPMMGGWDPMMASPGGFQPPPMMDMMSGAGGAGSYGMPMGGGGG
jgi:hypothetical protein